MLNVRLIARRVINAAVAITLASPSLLAAGDLPNLPQQRPGIEERLGAQVPLDLDFVDENGQPVKLAELVDRPTILAPVYYRCSNVCNLLQGGLAEVFPKLDIKPGSVRIISVSFDAAETPKMAMGSRRIYQAMLRDAFPSDQWHFLSGDQQNIDRLLDAIGYHVVRDGIEFIHPVVVAVLAPDGKIVRYLYGTRFLPMDVSLALLEASEGRVGNTISRIARICFSYDPDKKGYVFNILRVAGTLVFLSLGALFLVLVFGGRKKSTS
jgi:protein SCO1